MPPFTLKIHLPTGDPDGLRLIERSNWNGKAIAFPLHSYTSQAPNGAITA